MKIKSSVSTFYGKRSSKFEAVIYPSKKTNVTRRHQKTWNLENVAPARTLIDLENSIHAEAKRWETKILASYNRVIPEKLKEGL